MKFQIQILEKHLIKDVITIHMQAFPTFFLTFLGPKFLKEFYQSFTVDPDGVGFVAIQDNGNVLGAIVGPVNPNGYFKRLLKRRWFQFCLASTKAIFKKPTVIIRLFRALFYRGDSPSEGQRSLLSSIAVAPNAQGAGVGKSLVEKWCNEVKARGSSGCFLTTDTHQNDSINAFYLKCGWKLDDSKTTPEGRKMNYYVLDFKSD